MPRYIDPSKIKLTGLTFEDINNEVYFSLTDIRKAIEQTPTADVVEVRHGEWREANEKYPRYVCTACNHLFNNKNYNYCPCCGAKMDGERKEQE